MIVTNTSADVSRHERSDQGDVGGLAEQAACDQGVLRRTDRPIAREHGYGVGAVGYRRAASVISITAILAVNSQTAHYVGEVVGDLSIDQGGALGELEIQIRY